LVRPSQEPGNSRVPLAQLLLDGPLPLEPLLALAPRVAEAVALLHRTGAIHGSLRPSTLLVSQRGDPALGDPADAPPSHVPASPEQTGRTGSPVDRRADLHAIGASLYEMATGRPPFDSTDALCALHELLAREPEPPHALRRDLPRTFSDIVMRLLAKAPEDRYQSAEGLAHDLARLRDTVAAGGEGLFALGERDSMRRLHRAHLAGVSGDGLDLMGLSRASRMLACEPNLQRLAEGTSAIIAALSGADRVALLGWTDGEWWLLPPASGERPMPLAAAVECRRVSASAVRETQRTREHCVVDDALRDERFAADACFAGLACCSLMSVPLLRQGELRGILVLENRLGRSAFNDGRLDAIKLIAGQLAFALAGAVPHDDLERRVQARTRELEEIHARLVASAHRAGKAEIANSVMHNVGNMLNSIGVSASVVRRTVSRSKAEGLVRMVALLNEHEEGLQGFIGQGGRGKALLRYLNELAEALDAERAGILTDLERLAQGIDLMCRFVATHESHAGSFSIRETVAPHDVVEEALRMGLQGAGMATGAVRCYADIPPLALDRPRLLLILVNVVTNAAQAMHAVAQDARRITLATEIAREGESEVLRITVRDEGEGIAPEDLERIFAHGFTTRGNGHGFGLHASALAASEMGATLAASSEGRGRGATFKLTLAISRA
jgi:signal transduction histidine kinase